MSEAPPMAQRSGTLPTTWHSRHESSCVSSPCANRVDRTGLFKAGYPTTLRGGSLADEWKEGLAAGSHPACAGMPEQPAHPISGCIQVAMDDASTAGAHQAPAHHAEKGNTPSPDRYPTRAQAAAAHLPASNGAAPAAGHSLAAGAETPFRQPLQQPGSTQVASPMQESPAHIMPDAELGKHAAPGACAAHHSLEATQSSRQHQQPTHRPSSAQVCLQSNMFLFRIRALHSTSDAGCCTPIDIYVNTQSSSLLVSCPASKQAVQESLNAQALACCACRRWRGCRPSPDAR